MTNHDGTQGDGARVSCVNRGKFLVEKTRDTRDTQDKQDAQDTRDTIKASRFDPDCVKKARETPDPQALKVILSWQKRRGVPESQRLETARAFLAVHNLNVGGEELLDLLNVEPFTCEYIQGLGFCVGDNCRMKLPPAERLILDTESVLIFHSSGEMDIKVAGRRKIVQLKKFFRRSKDGTTINTALFDEIFIECYYLPPNPPFDEEQALKVYQEWLERAEHVKVPVDPESGIEETVIEILTTRRDYYSFDLLKERKVPPKRGFFVDGDVVYVDAELLRELLEEAGVRDRKEKVARAVQRLLAGKAKQLRIGNERRYFWRFNLKAIQAVLRREGEEWEPEVITEPPEDDFAKALALEFRTEEEGDGDGF